MDIVAHYHGVNAGSQLRHDIDKWVRHCVQLCDRPEEYEHGGISPRGRLLSACSTTDEELEQFLPTPEVCNKEIRRARVVQPEQVWLTAVLDHFDLHPDQRIFTREELEGVVARLESSPNARQFSQLLQRRADEFDYRLMLERQRWVAVELPGRASPTHTTAGPRPLLVESSHNSAKQSTPCSQIAG